MFSAIVTLTLPLPVWLVDEVIVTNDAFEEAVHAQPLPAVTAMEAVAPAPAMPSVVLDSEYVHVGVGETGVVVVRRSLEHPARSVSNATKGNTLDMRSSVADGRAINKLKCAYSARSVTAGSTAAARRAGR